MRIYEDIVDRLWFIGRLIGDFLWGFLQGPSGAMLQRPKKSPPGPVSCENDKLVVWFGKTRGKPWETMGKPWENGDLYSNK